MLTFLRLYLPISFSFSISDFFCMQTTLLPSTKFTDCRTGGRSRNTTGNECQFPHFLFCFFLSMSQVLVPCFHTYTHTAQHSTAQQAFAHKQHFVQEAQILSEVAAPSFTLTPLYCSKTRCFHVAFLSVIPKQQHFLTAPYGWQGTACHRSYSDKFQQRFTLCEEIFQNLLLTLLFASQYGVTTSNNRKHLLRK